MTIVLTLATLVEDDVLDAQLAFHLHAGVDLVLVCDTGAPAASLDVVAEYERVGRVQRVQLPDVAVEARRQELARCAARSHGAAWVIDAEPGEFWWPRGESLQDVLVAVPPRYTVVQALDRTFLPSADARESFAERMTVRTALAGGAAGRRGEPQSWLRPLFRASPDLEMQPDGSMIRGRAVPLRAWYPIEVLRFPLRSVEQAERRLTGGATDLRPLRHDVERRGLEAARAGSIAAFLAEASVTEADLTARTGETELAVDVRLRDLLALLRGPAPEHGGASAFVPVGAAPQPLFVPPNVVDDAEYAAECAEVGEVDLERLERQIHELGQRLAALEHPIWPRVRRRVGRVFRR